MFTVALRTIPRGGGDLRTRATLLGLAEDYAVGAFGLVGDEPGELPGGLRFWKRAADPALGGLVGAAGGAALEWLRRPDGHPSDRYFTAPAARDLREVMRAFQPEVVVVEQLWLHRYLPILREHDCQLVLNTHNVEWPLHRELAARAGTRMWELLAERVESVERRAVEAADQIWCCSEADAALLHSIYRPEAPVSVVPNAVDVGSYRAPPGGGDGRSILFSGRFSYPPNAVAARFLLADVFPRLAGLVPGSRLILAGAEPTADMIATAESDSRILVTGPVDDIRPWFAQASALAVPLFEGGGTRFKVLEAFAAGVPVVSTGKGVEGLDARPGRHYLPAESPAEFVEALAGLLHDAARAEALVRDAGELVRSRYSLEAASARMLAALGAGANRKSLT